MALPKAASEPEERVKERTAALSQSLEQLKETQFQLIQNEKMSSIGVLVADIAHEFNNPVCIVVGNLNLAQIYLQAMINHIKLYQKQFPRPGSIIQKDAENMDIGFIL